VGPGALCFAFSPQSDEGFGGVCFAGVGGSPLLKARAGLGVTGCSPCSPGGGGRLG